jgi:ATP/maltotriose-dependent transcriptional regulator MalT
VLACTDSARRSFSLATLTASAGQLPEAQAALRGVVERPDFARYPELAGPVFSSLAIVSAYAGEGSEAIAWARRALDNGDSRATVELTAKQALALGLALSGRADEGIALLGSLSAARVEPEPFEAELMATRGNLKAGRGDLEAAVEDLSAVVRWSRAGTALRSLPNAYGTLAEAEYRLGRWDSALAHAHVAVSLADDRDQVWELAFTHAVASFVHAARGNRMPAAEHVAAARRAVEAAPLPLSVYYAGLAAAHLASLDGDWDAVLAALAPAFNGAQTAGKVLAAEAMLRTGRLEPARDVLDQLDATGVDGVELCRLRGALAYAGGHPADARAAFLKGRELAPAASPLARAALELEHGRFLRRTGSRRRAIAALREAREPYAALQARPFLAQCDAELAACGVRTQAGGEDDEVELTAREQVVAQLVASGKSNREVAAELYLSAKAIEYHLANIFAKLGLRSRHQLAARLARHD